MDEQLELTYPSKLYDGNPPSERSSETSQEAAQSVKGSANSKRTRILVAIGNVVEGVTDDELEEITGWRHQTVSARRRELVLLGLVKDSGRRRKTRSGRSATVWEAV